MNLDCARDHAVRLRALLAPHCQRIEIVGSVRRRKADDIKDIEILCIPTPARLEFGRPPVASLLALLDDWRGQGECRPRLNKASHPIAWGEKFRAMFWLRNGTGPPISVDLFMTTPEQWGMLSVIRTGPAEFSHLLVTPAEQGGALPAGMRVQDGRLWPGPVATPEERDVFEALGLSWVEPWERSIEWQRKYLRNERLDKML